MLLAVLQASLGENATVGFCSPYLNRQQTARYGLDHQITTARS